MNVKIKKLTDLSLLHKANSFTSGKESKMSLARAYALGHSTIRTQLFWVEMTDIPLFCASQYVRSNIGLQFYQKTKRPDRGGEDFNDVCRNIAFQVRTCWVTAHGFDKDRGIDTCINEADKIDRLPERFDRYAPTDLAGVMNAEAIINMSRKRLCAKASMETREIWEQVVDALKGVDPDLANHCVKPCVHCGFCRERPKCGFTNTERYKEERENYLRLFE